MNPRTGRRARIAWCLFDFANSPFPTIALTAFGAPYFTNVLVGKGGLTLGPLHVGQASAWGLTISLSMLLVTLSAPLLGAMADGRGNRRFLLLLHVVLCVFATTGLGFLKPGHALGAAALYVVANYAFEAAYVFYNAQLADLAEPGREGRLSGQAWALGYVGGLLALLLCLPLVPKTYNAQAAEHAGAVFWVVAAWYAVFSLPALLWVRDGPARDTETENRGTSPWQRVFLTLKTLRSTPVIAFFLAAYFLYNDGIVTVIEFVGVFTKEVLEFTPPENIALFLILNGIAAPGALAFGYVLDRWGGPKTIRLTLLIWLVVCAGVALSDSRQGFWPVAVLAAVVIGSTQASSRALMAQLAPRHRMTEYMGLLAVGGKASAIVGPSVYGFIADGVGTATGATATGHRVAVGAMGVLFLVSYLLMRRVKS